MQHAAVDKRALRRPALLLFILLPALLAGSLPPAYGRHAPFPQPAAMAAPSARTAQAANQAGTLGAASLRLQGAQRLFRIDGRGRIERVRRVHFGFATVVAGNETVQSFGGQQYAKLASGSFRGWWVASPNASPRNVVAFSSPRQVRFSAGTHLGNRFYAAGSVRTRRALNLRNSATFSASKRGTFGGQRFFYMADGPLANRWVAENRRHTLVRTTAPTGTPSPSRTDAAATWKTLVLMYRETDVTFTRPNGSEYHLRARLSNSMYDLTTDVLGRFRRSVNNWSDGLAALDMDFVDVPHPLSHLNRLSTSYWVGPDAVKADLDRYAPNGTYDSIIVIWNATDDAGVTVPVAGWGMTMAPGWWANGAGYTSVITPTHAWWWTDAVAPEEVFIHEWMHQVIFFHEVAGRMRLDLHAGPAFGYRDYRGSWKEWLSDVMQGRVRDGDRFRGVSPEIWAAGKPTRP